MPKTKEEINWEGRDLQSVEDRIRYRGNIPDDVELTYDMLSKYYDELEENAPVTASIYNASRNGKKIFTHQMSDVQTMILHKMEI